MAKLRVSPEATDEIDSIWLYIARESGSADIATRVTDSITHRLALLTRYPYIGRRRNDLRPGLRSFAVGDYVVIYRVEGPDTVFILHVLHGSRDIAGLLGE
jgi:toxin ParE1/3/4